MATAALQRKPSGDRGAALFTGWKASPGKEARREKERGRGQGQASERGSKHFSETRTLTKVK